MDALTSDGDTYDISKGVTNLLHSLFIQDYQSEPYHQHQNKVKTRFGHAKHYPKTVMNISGCPACSWLFCLQCICVVLNYLASLTLQGICPVQALARTTPDISSMLHFSFYEPVSYRIDSSQPDLNFPTTNQRLASPSGEGTTLPFPISYPQQSKNSLPLDPLDESTPIF